MSNENVLYGYQGKWLRANLTDQTLKDQVFDSETLKKYLGSSGMGTKILYDETGPETDPLGPDNVIIFAAGIMNNTKCLMAGRYQAISKSPLTGAFSEGNSGGDFGPMLRKAGYDGVIVNGKADHPVYISIAEGVAKIENAAALWGMDSFETSDKLQEIHGKKTVVACIGQAGENLVKYAAIMNDGAEGRCVGRGGLGAVMGSKNLKAIAVMGTVGLPIKNETDLNEDIKKTTETSLPKLTSLRKFGTTGAFAPYIGMGEIPIKNWQLGMTEKMENMTGQVMNETINVKPYFCAQCITGCGRSVQVTDGKYASIRTGGPEYETLGYFGPNILNTDLKGLQMANELCNRYGMDTISAGGAIAWAMEAYEYGLITKEAADGLAIEWGNIDATIELLRRIAFRENIGDLLAEGCAGAAKIIGKGSDLFAVHVRGMDPPAHDPRGHVSSGIAFVTNARGACHQAGTHSFEGYPRAVASVRFDKELTPGKSENMGAWVAEMQNSSTMIDSLGACKMGMGALGPNQLAKYTEWVNMITGDSITLQEMAEIGERIHNLKWLYNIRCGVTRADMKLPPRLATRKRGEGGNAETLPQIDMMLSDYFKQRGWSEFGVPLPETLKKLGLEEYAKDIPRPVGPALAIG